MAHSKSGKFAQKRDQPLFMAIPNTAVDFQEAYNRAAATLPLFREHLQNRTTSTYSAKLRFRDPDASERLGEDRFVFIWLNNVYYHVKEDLFSGAFFELPPELQKWHHVGQRLGFKGEDIFDWMMLTEKGRLTGGYTLRVARSHLPENERAEYDRYVGIRDYEPDE